MGEGADMLCTVPTLSLDVNEEEIFRGFFQSPSEKTERISPISLIFEQNPNLSDTQAKGYPREFLQSLLKLGRFLITSTSSCPGLTGKVNIAFFCFLLWGEKRDFE